MSDEPTTDKLMDQLRQREPSFTLFVSRHSATVASGQTSWTGDDPRAALLAALNTTGEQRD